MANLYEIEAGIEDCVDMETGEIIDEEKLDSLQMERDEKIENIALWIKDLLAEADAIKNEKATLAHRESVCRNKAEALRKYLQGFLDGEKYESARVKISYRRSESVKVLDMTEIPVEYLKFSDPEVNKTLVKKAIKDGEIIQGVELVENSNMQIK